MAGSPYLPHVSRFRSALAVALVALTGFVCGPSYAEEGRAQPLSVANRGSIPAVGSPAPNFKLKDLSGETRTLEAYRGTVVMLNFWATWCGPCRVEMPSMEALYKKFSRRDFEILAVSSDTQGAVVTRPFRDEMGLTFPILHDADFRVGLMYGVRTLPVTVLVDRQGVIVDRVFGAVDWQQPDAVKIVEGIVRGGRS
ncbi:MAG: TlpA disulfide reductase family protein [Nitrospiraceae bacterium]